MKKLVKHILFQFGITSLWHRSRNKRTLTVLMLHRILSADLQKKYGANPEWTMTPTVFSDFLIFLKKHYNPVSAKQIESSAINGKPLPNNALLLTFDDGWRDNEQYAMEILLKHKFPATIFIVSNTIGQVLPFWQELIYSYCISSKSHFAECVNLSGMTTCQTILDLIYALENDPAIQENKQLVMNYCGEKLSNLPRQLLSEQEIFNLFNHGITIGSHGASHNKLGLMTKPDQVKELESSKSKLESIINHEIAYLSYPHGNNNKDTIPAARESGYKLMFDSRVKLNKTVKNSIARIHISEKSITSDGIFSALKSSYRLFFIEHS